MSKLSHRRRVLLAVAEPARGELRQLFQADILRDWEICEADSLERARFLLQLDPCDVLLVDCSLYREVGRDDLSWLVAHRRTPVLFLSDGNAETIADAVRQGAQYWLPGDLARRHVPVLAAMLHQAAEFGDVQRGRQETSAELEDTRRQVSRLVDLLWQAVPGEGRARWYTQRYMLERLEEEVSRTQRYGGPLAVILGEVDIPRSVRGEDGQAATWIVDQISRLKRRCDVAGQYGLQGFMLLLPQTDERGATGCFRRLRAHIDKHLSLDSMSVQFGISCYSSEARSAKSLLSRAEAQLERSKVAV
jgi:diguanylate cyclase (GGDEF)-like protein